MNDNTTITSRTTSIMRYRRRSSRAWPRLDEGLGK